MEENAYIKGMSHPLRPSFRCCSASESVLPAHPDPHTRCVAASVDTRFVHALRLSPLYTFNMKWDTVSFACLATTAAAAPQAPASPAGCSPSYNGEFQIIAQRTNAAPAKRNLERRYLAIHLENGVLTDQQGRTGYIADNFQFQFDGPPQAGALTASGFAACEDGNLALGSSKVFYQCRSGEFYNLYDRNWAPQCEAINIKIQGTGNIGHPSSGPPPASQIVDGQLQAPGMPAPGMPAPGVPAPGVPAPGAVTQIADGQIQAPTGAVPGPAPSQPAGGQVYPPAACDQHPQVPACPVQPPAGEHGGNTGQGAITQIGDGQIQAPRQVQAPRQIQQIPDGQIQNPSAQAPAPTEGTGSPPAGSMPPPASGMSPPAGGAPIGQIPDGQIQAPTAVSPPMASEAPPMGGETPPAGRMSPPAGGVPISQIDDGQIQAPTGGPPPPAAGTSTYTTTYCPTASPAPVPPPASPAPDPSPPPAGPIVTLTETYCPPAQTPQPPPPVSNGTVPQPPPQQQPTVAPVPGSGEKLLPGSVAALAVGAAGAFFYL